MDFFTPSAADLTTQNPVQALACTGSPILLFLLECVLPEELCQAYRVVPCQTVDIG